MNDLSTHLKFVSRCALFFLSACFLVWALVPQFKVYAAGLVLGTIISLINARILSYKIITVTKLLEENGGKKANLGFVARVSMVLIGTMISVKLPQFNLIATISGFFFAQATTFFTGLITTIKAKTGMERGEN